MFDEQLAVAQSEGMEALFEFKVRRDEIPESLREGPLSGEYKERFLKNTPETFADTANALFTMPDLRDELLQNLRSRLGVPRGERRRPYRFQRGVSRSNVPDCATSIIPDAGHSVFWDQPDAFIAQMEQFLEKNPV